MALYSLFDYLVPLTGLEPVRCFQQGIFLLLYVTIAALLRCSLEYVFTILLVYGGAGKSTNTLYITTIRHYILILSTHKPIT